MAIYYQASGTFVLSGQELAALSPHTELARMKLGHELFKFTEATRLPGRDSDSYTLAITEEVILSF